MRRFIVLLAAAIPLAATIGVAAVAASPAPAALAASTCHDEGAWADFTTSTSSQYWDALGTGTDAAVDSEYVVYSDGTAPGSNWCVVNSTDYSGFYLFRLQGTSECATYGGPVTGTASGTGDVYLKPCDDSLLAQNWDVDAIQGNGEISLWTEYNEGSCLSADNMAKNGYSSGDAIGLLLVDDCDNSGGQNWTYTGSTVPSTPVG
jgi:hypothetical protein